MMLGLSNIMRLVCPAVATVLFAANAAAQSRGIYIQAGALLDSLASSTTGGPPVTVIDSGPTFRWNDLNGDRRWQPGEEESLIPGLTTLETRTSSARFAPGASLALGVFVTPSVSLRLEGSFQGDRVTTTEVTPRTLFTPVATRRAVGIMDMFVSAAWHQGESRKVALTYLAGMVFRRQREDLTMPIWYIAIPSVGGLPAPSGASVLDEEIFTSTLYSAGVMAGLDVAVSVSPRVAIVPQLRIITANHDFSVRPAIAMRWRP